VTGSGDRHLRRDGRVRLGDPLPGPREVAVYAGEAATSSYGGQATLSLLVDLLARQFGVVERIWIDVPETDVQPAPFPRTKPAPGSRLTDALIDVGRLAAGDEIEVVAGRPTSPRVAVLVGDGVPAADATLATLQATGNGLSAWCGSFAGSTGRPLDSLLPFGPHLAACMAADRVFRLLRGADVSGSWSLDLAAMGDPVLPSPAAAARRIELPPAYLVGLGAVGAGALFSLACAPTIESELVGVDPDVANESNRNRLLTANYRDVGEDKVELASRLAGPTNVRFWPNKMLWADYLTSPSRQAPDELKAAEPIRFEWLLSAVDKNVSRRDLANVMPRHVLSGSTDGLVAQATYYSMVGDCECLACNHPVPSFDLDDLRAQLAHMGPRRRSIWYAERDVGHDEQAAIEDLLRDPDCGQAGAATLRRLGLSDVDWAVGFVSVAAGVMLAARFTLLASAASFAPPASPEERLFFLAGGSADHSYARRKPSCPLCSSADAQARFAARWPAHL